MATVVLTGFPGFLASAFLPNLLSRLDPATSVTCLVQSHHRPLAEQRAAEIASAFPDRMDRIRLVEGDITRPGLGLSDNGRALQPETREVYHFAALYDLALSRPLGMKINVQGTVNVLDFIEACSRFDRLHYVSTCYVSGRFPGDFTENDLVHNNRFNNFYEETKYLAEVEVQNRMKRGLNATIYRPSIVVGDSRTGATQKYDGPYGALRWVLRWHKVAPLVSVGNGDQYHVNLAPRDFVVAAISRLSGLEVSRNIVYQLCDPNPPTVNQLYEIFSRTTGRRIVKFPLPAALAKGLFKYLPGASRTTHIVPEAIDYFTQPTEFTCENTLRDLDGSGIACPAFADYAPTMVRFVQEHPDISADAMR